MSDSVAPQISRNDAASRYEIALDGAEVGFADYRDLPGGVREMPHTVVHEQYGGRGFAGQLVKFALEDIRAAGMRVRPTCPYVDAYIEKHPEFADLRETA